MGELPSDPPHDDKKPEDEDKKDDIPQPAAPLAPRHVVHAPERASEYAGRFCECVVLSQFKASSVGRSVGRSGDQTHHLAKLNGRVADLVPNTDGNLSKTKKEHLSVGEEERRGRGRRTSLSNFTFAPSPSIASSFWPSRSSAKRVPANCVPSVVDEEGSWYPGYGDERPEWGGVGA